MSAEQALDLIWGIEGIAEEIRRTPRQTHYMLSCGAIEPARKVAGRWCVDRPALKAMFTAAMEPNHPRIHRVHGLHSDENSRGLGLKAEVATLNKSGGRFEQ